MPTRAAQRYAHTASHSFHMPLRYQTPERFARAHVVPYNGANFLFRQSVARLAHQTLDLGGDPQQPQLKPDVRHETLQRVSCIVR
jgi:hypothetical protein